MNKIICLECLKETGFLILLLENISVFLAYRKFDSFLSNFSKINGVKVDGDYAITDLNHIQIYAYILLIKFAFSSFSGVQR